MNLLQLRQEYHKELCSQVLGYRKGAPNIADGSSKRSVDLAEGILTKMGFPPCGDPPVGQRAGALFETLTRDYLNRAFQMYLLNM